MKELVIAALNELRPNLQADGGDIELIDVSVDGVVKVRLRGACAGCPMSQMTMANVIEGRLKARVPGVKKVVAV